MKPHIVNVQCNKPYTNTVAHELNELEDTVADKGENDTITVFTISLRLMPKLMDYLERNMIASFGVNRRLETRKE